MEKYISTGGGGSIINTLHNFFNVHKCDILRLSDVNFIRLFFKYLQLKNN